MSESLPEAPRTWQRPGFLISTNPNLLSLPAINHAFGLEIVYWTQPVPEEILRKIITNSFCFGLYEVQPSTSVSASASASPSTTDPTHDQADIIEAQNLKQIGFARLVGDRVTFAYFTDLYVLPEYQGLGLGGWVIDCIGEVVDEMPYLRWVMLRTSLEQSQVAYEKRLGMKVLQSGDVRDGPVMMGRKGRVGGP